MKRNERQFNKEQIERLKKSASVKEVYSNHIEYTTTFKLRAIAEYKQGKTPLEIFTDSDLPLDCITQKNAFNLIKKWLKQEEKIVSNIDDDKMELLARIAYLEAENEYLKKLK